MKNFPHPIIAREGWPALAVAVSIAVLGAQFLAVRSIPFWIATILVLQFFRDPVRVAPRKTNAALSPADGRIVVVEKTQDPYVGCEALRMGVFMNMFNAQSNRAPVDGKVLMAQCFPGEFINADLDKASRESDRTAVVIATGSGEVVTCLQMAGRLAQRILCYAKVDDMLARAQCHGLIRFGSRVDIYLPFVAKPKVGDRVAASETILATL